MDIFDLSAKLTLDSSEFKNGLRDAENESSSFGSTIANGFSAAMKAGAVAVGALTTAVVAVSSNMVSSVKEVASLGDEIDKQSQKLGLSAEAYQEWDFVLNHAGTSMQSMTTGMKTLTNKLDDAKSGSANALEMFSKLGISMEDLNSMSREEIFEASIYGFQQMADSTERAALANDLFGKSGQELTPLFNTTTEETKAMIEQVNNLGGVLSQNSVKAAARFQDSLQDMQTAMSGLKNNMADDFLPAFADIMDGVALIFSGDSEGAEMIQQGIEGIIENVQELIPNMKEVADQILPVIVNAIIEGLPLIFSAATDIVMTITSGIVSSLPSLIESAGQIIGQLVTGLITMLPEIVNSAVQIIVSLSSGISQSLPTLIPTIVEVIMQIAEVLLDNLDTIIECAFEIIIALSEGLIDALPKLIDKAPTIIEKLISAIIKLLPKILETGAKLIVELGVGLIKAIPQIVAKIPQIVKALVNGFLGLGSSFLGIGSNIVSGIWNGISAGWKWLTDSVNKLTSGLISGVKGVLGIHSPSKVFAQIGGYMAEGMDEGWSKEIEDVKKDIEGDLDFSSNINMNAESSSGSTGGYGSTNIVMNIYGAVGQDVRELAEEVESIIAANTRRSSLAWQ